MVMLVLIVAGTMTVIVIVFVIVVIMEITIRMLNTDSSHAKSRPMGGCFAFTTKSSTKQCFWW